jgi:phosphomannomutase
VLNPKIFKAYDIRAEIGVEMDTDGARRVAEAFFLHFGPKTVAVGRDMRVSGPELAKAVIDELVRVGVNVTDLDVISTDSSYYAAGTLDVDFVIMITASHNPPRYNGFKISKRGGIALEEADMFAIRDMAVTEQTAPSAATPGTVTKDMDVVARFVAHAVTLIDASKVKPLRILVDAGNGMAGKIIPELQKHLPIQVTPLYFELDGNFPNHLANPLIEEGQKDARAALQKGGFDLGALFDGDGDRMFLMDEKGDFISGTITTAMVTKQILKMQPGSTILYNAICGRIVPETVAALGGTSHRTRVGHSIIKRDMRSLDAVFAGEHSGHYFFRDFFSADSGVITFLYVLQLISEENKPVSQIVAEFDKYPQSGEINFAVTDREPILAELKETFGASAQSVDDLDGVSIWYPDWWLNVRGSNTQPVLRLNVEANTPEILAEKTAAVRAIIEKHGGVLSLE